MNIVQPEFRHALEAIERLAEKLLDKATEHRDKLPVEIYELAARLGLATCGITKWYREERR